MLPTPYPDLNAVLRRLVQGVRAVLGTAFTGAYLQGSFAVGDFDEHSDCDFIVAAEEELSDAHVHALQELHPRIYDIDCEWAKHLEGSYFPTDVLRDVGRRATPLWYLDHGARSLVRSEHCNTVVVRWTVREHGVTLAGPRPETLVDPIPTHLLRQEILDTIRGEGQEILSEPERYSNRFYQGFIVLNFCRMLNDLRRGRVGSKRAGAEWAKATLDPSWTGLIDRSWSCRPDPARSVRRPADPDEFARTLEFIRYAIEASAGLMASVQDVGPKRAPAATVIAETGRIVLRPFGPSDLDDLAPILADAEVMRFSAGGPWSRDRTRRFIEGCLQDYSEERWGFGLWAVVRKEDARLIGYCGLTRYDDVDGSPEVEIGCRLSPDCWGRGLATEAASAARDYALEHLGMARLISMVEPDNAASIRVVEKIGMTFEKEIQKWNRRVLVYSLSPEPA